MQIRWIEREIEIEYPCGIVNYEIVKVLQYRTSMNYEWEDVPVASEDEECEE